MCHGKGSGQQAPLQQDIPGARSGRQISLGYHQAGKSRNSSQTCFARASGFRVQGLKYCVGDKGRIGSLRDGQEWRGMEGEAASRLCLLIPERKAPEGFRQK